MQSRKKTRRQQARSDGISLLLAPQYLRPLLSTASVEEALAEQPAYTRAEDDAIDTTVDEQTQEQEPDAAVSAPPAIPACSMRGDTNIEEAENVLRVAKYMDGADEWLLCGLPARSYLSGRCVVLGVRGKHKLHGAMLHPGRVLAVNIPAWSSAFPLEVTEEEAPTKEETHGEVAHRLNYACIQLAELREHSNIIAIKPDGESLSCDVFRDLHTRVISETISDKVTETQSISREHYCLWTGSNTDAFDEARSYLHIPQSWQDLAQYVQALSASSTASACVCGPKGTGKSTFVRYLVNSLLNYCPAVAVLDVDVGQPELNPPGMIALHFVYDPLLSLPHDHMQIPVRACFLGNVTVKAEPEMLTTSIQTLFEVYQQATTILSRCSIFGTAVVHDRLRKPSESSFIGEMNPGGTLTPYELERVLHMCEVCLEHHSFATQLQQTSLPLIVNTDGWLRSMGSDLLGYIIETIKPLVLAQLGISSRIPRPMFQIPENCRSFELDGRGATRSGESSVSAVNLRTLRLLKYFLQPHKDSSSELIMVRSGAVSDPDRALPKRIAGLFVYRVPLTSVRLRTITEVVEPALILAAFNGSLVGIVSDPHDTESSKNLDGCVYLSLSPGQTRSLCVDCVGSVPSTGACIGLGIVRAIDPHEGVLYVSTPVNVAALARQKVYLVKGLLTLPSSMLFSPNSPSHPYLSCETTGEGAAQIRGRSVKRKGRDRRQAFRL